MVDMWRVGDCNIRERPRGGGDEKVQEENTEIH